MIQKHENEILIIESKNTDNQIQSLKQSLEQEQKQLDELLKTHGKYG